MKKCFWYCSYCDSEGKLTQVVHSKSLLTFRKKKGNAHVVLGLLCSTNEGNAHVVLGLVCSNNEGNAHVVLGLVYSTNKLKKG